MEDIHFLKKHGKEESFLFKVDSNARDLSAYPNPSEYAIEFNAPFKNVIGLDLIDAIVPRTEYGVDEGFNGLVYSVNGNPKRSLDIVPGDYNLLSLSETVNKNLQDGLRLEPVSMPYVQTSRARFVCGTPFKLFMHESSIRKPLGFYGTQKLYDSSVAPPASVRTHLGPSPGFRTVHLDENTPLRQRFVASVSGPPAKVLAYIESQTSSAPVEVRLLAAGEEEGEETTLATAVFDVLAVNTSTITATFTLEFQEASVEAGITYVLEILSQDADIYVNVPRDASEDVAESEGSLLDFAVACEVWVFTEQHEVVAPGLVDLTGIRYMLIRCPEIESYLHQERAYESFYPGMGMVKLGSNGYLEQRFDFASFPSRRLVLPIGKLSKLTFRLERPDGTLYNSKGIDNCFLLLIRYYVGISSEQQHLRILNPHYTPNTTHFLEQKWKREVDARDKDAGSWRTQ
jgi:hypothetical protein